MAASLKTIQGAALDSSLQARLLAASRGEVRAWLQTLPASSLGLRMNDDVFRVATGLRLGVLLCRPTQMPVAWVISGQPRNAWPTLLEEPETPPTPFNNQ